MIDPPPRPRLKRAAIVRAAFAALWTVTLVASCDLVLDGEAPSRQRPPRFSVIETSIVDGDIGVALNQPFSVRFNQYLDADSFEYFNAFEINSGGVPAWGIARYRLTDRTLTFYPTVDMLPRLVYTASINPDTVRSLSGEALPYELAIRFQTAESGTVSQDRRIAPTSFAEEVAPILESCRSCHREGATIGSLTYDDLVGRESAQIEERLLVRPFAPADSYLLQKVLPDYPDRRLEQMPPSWAAELPLSLEEIGRIERWIAGGAEP